MRWRLQEKKIAELHEIQFALHDKEKETRMCTCVCEREREKESEIRVGDARDIKEMTRVRESARARERGWVGDVQYTREREREKERSRHS